MAGQESRGRQIPPGMEPELAALFLEPPEPLYSERSLKILAAANVRTRIAFSRLLQNEPELLSLPDVGKKMFEFMCRRGASLRDNPPTLLGNLRAGAAHASLADVRAARDAAAAARREGQHSVNVPTDLLERLLVSAASPLSEAA